MKKWIIIIIILAALLLASAALNFYQLEAIKGKPVAPQNIEELVGD
jgi:hypothetical protein